MSEFKAFKQELCQFGHTEIPEEKPRYCIVNGEIPRSVDHIGPDGDMVYCDCAVCSQFAEACGWCGEPMPSKEGDIPSLARYCCDRCSTAWHDKYQPGQWISVGDMTREQLNSLFKDIGLQLEDVGDRQPN